MILKDISQLKPSNEQAIIINVGTKLVSTLALMSSLRYAGMPVLVIDCESKDDSWEHFSRLMGTYDFDLLSAPLKKHGETLDWLFGIISAEKVLLVDSDLEILGPDILQIMRSFIDDQRVFGCGFTHGPCWLSTHEGVGYYQERMWIPLTWLRVSCIRQALQAGCSFTDKNILNDCAFSHPISRFLALRFEYPSMRNWKLPWLDWLKASYYGLKPCYVYCDTGAMIYQYLKYQQGLYFAGLPAEVQQQYATHFHGVTRVLLDPHDTNSASLNDIASQVRDRLQSVYGITV